MNLTPFQRKFTNGYWLIALILRHFFTLECCLRTWLERTLIYSSKNHELCIPFGQNFNPKLLIALFFCELLLCRCILNLLLLNSYSILAADFCKNFLTKAYSQSLERPYRETTIGGFCYLFFGEVVVWCWCSHIIGSSNKIYILLVCSHGFVNNWTWHCLSTPTERNVDKFKWKCRRPFFL